MGRSEAHQAMIVDACRLIEHLSNDELRGGLRQDEVSQWLKVYEFHDDDEGLGDFCTALADKISDKSVEKRLCGK